MIDMFPIHAGDFNLSVFGMLKAICAQSFAPMGWSTFCFDGFLATFTTIGCNILFLTVFRGACMVMSLYNCVKHNLNILSVY